MKSRHFFKPSQGIWAKKVTHAHYVFPPSTTDTVNKTILFFLFPVRMSILFHQNQDANTSDLYKITKIVRALRLADRSFCMRVCKHGCGVKLFGFSRANRASSNLKKFWGSKLDKFTLFTHPFMENRYKEGESIFLRLS